MALIPATSVSTSLVTTLCVEVVVRLEDATGGKVLFIESLLDDDEEASAADTVWVPAGPASVELSSSQVAVIPDALEADMELEAEVELEATVADVRLESLEVDATVIDVGLGAEAAEVELGIVGEDTGASAAEAELGVADDDTGAAEADVGFCACVLDHTLKSTVVEPSQLLIQVCVTTLNVSSSPAV